MTCRGPSFDDKDHIDDRLGRASLLAHLDGRRREAFASIPCLQSHARRLDVLGAIEAHPPGAQPRRAGHQGRAGRTLEAHDRRVETAVPVLTVTGTVATISSKSGQPTVTDACQYPRMRSAARTVRSYSRGLVSACRAWARSPTSSSSSDRRLLVDPVESHVDSLCPRPGGDVDDQRANGFIALDSDFHGRLIRGLPGQLASNDLFGLFDQKALEHRLRPRRLDFLHALSASDMPVTRTCVSGPASIV